MLCGVSMTPLLKISAPSGSYKAAAADPDRNGATSTAAAFPVKGPCPVWGGSVVPPPPLHAAKAKFFVPNLRHNRLNFRGSPPPDGTGQEWRWDYAPPHRLPPAVRETASQGNRPAPGQVRHTSLFSHMESFSEAPIPPIGTAFPPVQLEALAHPAAGRQNTGPATSFPPGTPDSLSPTERAVVPIFRQNTSAPPAIAQKQPPHPC